jgi:predicted phage terminase large subunit-like protein
LITTYVRLHDSPVIWPERRDEETVKRLRASTPIPIWNTTYQGSIASQMGTTFKREWWEGINRYGEASSEAVARYMSLDTASSSYEKSAFTAWCVADLMPDYRIRIIEVGRERIEMPDLLTLINRLHKKFDGNGLLRAIVIEDKSSGIGAIQTMRRTADVGKLIVPFTPREDKQTRWNEVSVYCSLGCVLLPVPGGNVPWLFDFEDELFNIPNSEYFDQADSFAQICLYLSNILGEGYHSRLGDRQ